MKLLNPKPRPDEALLSSRSASALEKPKKVKPVEYAFDPDDPLLAYLRGSSGSVEIDALDLESNALNLMKSMGVKIVLPLISQGELIGILNLGPRRSEQGYSIDDRRLLGNLALQAAPALRVAQLARQQQLEARQRERIEQELKIGRAIQETLLPQAVPDITNWELDALWKPAREVSGDFYDFIHFPDGRLGIIVGDVTDKGVPAALVMASAHTILQSTAEKLISPGIVLQTANDLLESNIPYKMFVTCLYMLIEPSTGKITYANAGHNPPYKSTAAGAVELFASGMPLGLMPGMEYDELVGQLLPGEGLLLYSDGLTEAHNSDGEMFGFSKVRDFMNSERSTEGVIISLLDDLANFTGPGWEQEDDVTFVYCKRLDVSGVQPDLLPQWRQKFLQWEQVGVFEVNSTPGGERQVQQRVVDIVKAAGFSSSRLDYLRTAVAETALNAIEHGNQYDANKVARIEVLRLADQFAVLISDEGLKRGKPAKEEPNLEAKLDGLQTTRGWGLFLVESMADGTEEHRDPGSHTVILYFNHGE